MPLRYDFRFFFEVAIIEVIIVYYEDDSRKDGQTGIGMYGPSILDFEVLGSTPTIFPAEMYGLCTYNVQINIDVGARPHSATQEMKSLTYKPRRLRSSIHWTSSVTTT
jgi:hypothetical protein